MERFRYTAQGLSGEYKEGVRRAGSYDEVLSWLRGQSLIPVEVSPITYQDKSQGQVNLKIRVKSADLSAFCWQLTTMVEGGVTIATALDVIARDMENRQLAVVVMDLSERLKRGESFSSSVAAYPKIFNEIFCAMILVSETGGSLPTVLQRMAKYYDERDKVLRKVKSAIAYPIFCLVIIILILIVIMTYVVPMFKDIFENMGEELPAITRIFFAFNDLLAAYIVYIVTAGCLVVLAAIAWGRTEKGFFCFSRLALSAPMFGRLLSQSFISIFCRTIATLLSAGVSIIDSLEILSRMTKNVVIKSAILDARQRVVEGTSISEGLSTSGFFPNMVISMVTVGEESGSLPKVMDRTSDYYERRVETLIATMTALLEPIMIVTVGIIVLTIVMALYMPIFMSSGSA